MLYVLTTGVGVAVGAEVVARVVQGAGVVAVGQGPGGLQGRSSGQLWGRVSVLLRAKGAGWWCGSTRLCFRSSADQQMGGSTTS